jgi:hypothetical protein
VILRIPCRPLLILLLLLLLVADTADTEPLKRELAATCTELRTTATGHSITTATACTLHIQAKRGS